MTTVRALAPAKLNFGLEVVGKRSDGFHDIVSVIQTVSIFDRLTFMESSKTTFHVSTPSLADNDNLVLVATRRFHETSTSISGTAITLKKRIPAAAGLGGASSDAAATIAALSLLYPRDSSEVSRQALASSIGSDVSFLLTGGTALVEGRGEIVTQLNPLSSIWFVVLVPAISIPRKTASLYAALQPTDYSPGQRVRDLASQIDQGRALDPDLLGNAFVRPLRALKPEVAVYERALILAGAPFVSLSGAGPALYTAVSEHLSARTIASNLRREVDRRSGIFVCRPVARVPLVWFELDTDVGRHGTEDNVQTFER